MKGEVIKTKTKKWWEPISDMKGGHKDKDKGKDKDKEMVGACLRYEGGGLCWV